MSSDPDRSVDSDATLAPDSEVSCERRSVDLPSETAIESAPSANQSAEPPRSVDPGQGSARKRSSIRPARPDWRPSTRPASNPPRPMVVVYSGEGDRPDRWWDDLETPSCIVPLESDTPVPPDPALAARDLRPPPTARFPEMVPPPPHATIVPPPEFAPLLPRTSLLASSEGDARTEAPVALSEPSRGAAGTAPLDASSRRARLLRHSSVRRAAVVVVGACLGAYIAMHKSEPSTAPAEAAEVAANAEPTHSALAAAPAEPPALAPPVPPAAPEVPAPAAPAPVQAESEATAAAAPSAAVSADATAEPSGPGTVAIEVVPYDAQLTVGGIIQHGPPYILSVQKGRRVVFVVARKGYIARRVTIDGSEPKLTIGLLQNRNARAEPAAGGESEPVEAGRDSRLRVRSGL